MSSSHETFSVSLILFALPIAFGFAIAYWTNVRFLFLMLGLTAFGLSIGALVGTTYTHAFDILWWWYGLFFGAIFCLGAAGARLLRRFLKKR